MIDVRDDLYGHVCLSRTRRTHDHRETWLHSRPDRLNLRPRELHRIPGKFVIFMLQYNINVSVMIQYLNNILMMLPVSERPNFVKLSTVSFGNFAYL